MDTSKERPADGTAATGYVEIAGARGGRVTGAHVCGTCGRIAGRLRLEAGGSVLRHLQHCLCAPPELRARKPPGYDLATIVELCRCCGFELIPSGSRWSTFFCSDCRELVLAANRALGGSAIPIGRHSVVNGHFLSAGQAGLHEHAETFVAAVHGLSAGIDRLEDWAGDRVKRNLAALGLDGGDPPLAGYVSRARALLDSHAAAEELTRQWRLGSRPAANSPRKA